MFYYHYPATIDSKNRLQIPIPFRKSAEHDDEPAAFFLTLGFDKCLFMFTVPQWQEIESQFKAGTPLNDEKSRRLQRTFFGNAAKCTCDKRGRIVLPTHLMQQVDLKKEVTFVGVSHRAEIWDTQLWAKHNQSNVEDYGSLSNHLKM